MIPICLVTGFLGTGKTTLLGHFVEQYKTRKLVYLINEFSEIDIDSQRISVPSDQRVSIAGGSIFCRCLVSDFIRALQAIETHFGEGHQPPEGVIIEGSGIADPNVISQMLHETKLDQRYALQQIITVIEPGSFLKLIHTLPNIVRQVDASDTVLINKIDMYDEELVKQTYKEVLKINPAVHIIQTTFCDVSLDPFAQFEQSNLMGDYAPCRDPHYSSVSIRHDSPLQWPRVKQEIEAIPGAVYRVKGFILANEGTLQVDYATGVWDERIEEKEPRRTESEFIVIVDSVVAEEANLIMGAIKNNKFNA